jgi:hypothetical protein
MKPQFHTVISEVGSKNRYNRGMISYVLKYNARLWEKAMCRGIDTEVFYPVQELFTRDEERMIEKMCIECPVMMACLEWGLAHERYGVWGGTTPPMRHKMRKRIGWGLTDPQHGQ